MKATTPSSAPRNTNRGPRLYSWRWLALLALGCVGVIPSRATDAPKLPPLSTISGSPRFHCKFVWADLVTDDVVAAKQFYTRLFGWNFRSFGNYTIAANDDRPLGGLFQLERPKDRPEAKPRWFAYISVPNVERAQEAVTKAGGRVLAAQVSRLGQRRATECAPYPPTHRVGMNDLFFTVSLPKFFFTRKTGQWRQSGRVSVNPADDLSEPGWRSAWDQMRPTACWI